MKAETMRALRRIRGLTAADWMAVAAHARSSGVGGWRWEETWQAATTGHDAGALGFRLARVVGATPLAAAAAAGAVAAIEAGGALSEEDLSVLVEPLGAFMDEPIDEPRTVPARFEQVWAGLRRFQPTAAKPIG